jgi:hypothetical protein
MNLTLRKSGWLDDWYVIEFAKHDGRNWIEADPRGHLHLRSSARISDADVEGESAEMRAIARALRDGTGVRFTRCAVRFSDDTFELSSPRNSIKAAIFPRADATALADEIDRVLDAH